MQRVLDKSLNWPYPPRITSAHAESTLKILTSKSASRDHLCACREYETMLCIHITRIGSPLRMQRVPSTIKWPKCLPGITSAHAESTRYDLQPRRRQQDHLCACREYLYLGLAAPTFTGSPLRMQRVPGHALKKC